MQTVKLEKEIQGISQKMLEAITIMQSIGLELMVDNGYKKS